MADFIVKAKIPQGQGYAFRVVGIHHPIEPTVTAGDLYISQIGPLLDEVGDLFRRS